MKRLRATLIAAVIGIAAFGSGIGNFGAASTKDSSGSEQTQVTRACARCGDGVCAKSCENKTTCPADCGGGGGPTSAH